ncbi:hypothetical protein U1Q18_034083 [Sarracenia purpurea var. burkii]
MARRECLLGLEFLERYKTRGGGGVLEAHKMENYEIIGRDFRTRHIHCTIVLSHCSGIGLQRDGKCFEAQRSQSPLTIDLGTIHTIHGLIKVPPALHYLGGRHVKCDS